MYYDIGVDWGESQGEFQRTDDPDVKSGFRCAQQGRRGISEGGRGTTDDGRVNRGNLRRRIGRGVFLLLCRMLLLLLSRFGRCRGIFFFA